MTTHYLDLTLLPDPEFSHAHLLGALMNKLHQALVHLGCSDIGISFPGYTLRPRGLGSVLRLHGGAEALARLMALDWLRGMRDHLHIAPLAVAPANAPHRRVQRRQFKTSAERLRRRRLVRKQETAEQAALAIPDSAAKRPNLPFVQLRSGSTRQAFTMYIEHGAFQAEAAGAFNSYGLSNSATIPWF